MTTYTTSAGDTVDYIAWKYYGQTDKQTVEQVLAANVGLADYGPILPANIQVQLPALAKPATAKGVKLWD
jgi:phage tail protein X